MADEQGQLIWRGQSAISFIGAGVGAGAARAAQRGYETSKDAAPVSADGSHGNPPGYLKASATWGAFRNGQQVMGMAQDENGDATPPPSSDMGGESSDLISLFAFNAWYAGFVAVGAGGRPGSNYIDVGVEAMQSEARDSINDFFDSLSHDLENPIDTEGEGSALLESFMEGAGSLMEEAGSEIIGAGLALL
jgi:hypothetical protein